jgi:aspartokinase
VLSDGGVGGTLDGVATTMGSESSDLSATVIAASLGAREVVIWKNVAGIFDADPELIPEAKLIRQLTLLESEEIGRRGARVLFPTAAEPLAGLEREPILRIASPAIAIRTRTGNFKSTTISREISVRTSYPKPLALALDPHLTALRLKPRIILDTNESPGRTRKLREKFAQLRARTLYTQTTPEEVFAVLRRELRSDLVESLASSFEITEETAVAAIGVIVRSSESDVRASFAELRSEVLRSLRQFSPISTFTTGKSILTLVDDASGEAALKKLYRDLIGR